MVADPIFFEGHSQSGRENYPYSFAQLILPPNSLSYAITLRQGLPAVPTPDLTTGAVPIPGFAYAETYDNANYVRGYIQTPSAPAPGSSLCRLSVAARADPT